MSILRTLLAHFKRWPPDAMAIALKRRLERLLRANGIPISQARRIAGEFFNPDHKGPNP